MSIYICRYKWSTKYLWVQMEYKIRLLFVGQISLFYGYKYENRNSRTFVLQTEHLFYAKLYTINRMECICRHKFFGVQMEYKICKPFVGTINIMYSISLITAEGSLRQQRGRPPGTHGRFFVGWSPCVRW